MSRITPGHTLHPSNDNRCTAHTVCISLTMKSIMTERKRNKGGETLSLKGVCCQWWRSGQTNEGLMLHQLPHRGLAYLPDIRTFGFSGPGDDARYCQASLTGVHKVCGVHLPSQTLDVLQNRYLHLRRQHTFNVMAEQTASTIPLPSVSLSNLPWGLVSESDRL